MNAITRLEAQEWVAELQQARRGRNRGRPTAAGGEVPFLSAETVAAITHVMSGLYRAAMKEHPPLVLSNPFAELELPPIEPHAIYFYEPDDAESVYFAAGEIGAQWRTLIELGMQAGLRFEELAGLHGHRVDWLRGPVEVIDVMTWQGLREWPKSKRSHRTVPVPPGVLDGMSVLMAGRDRDSLVFRAPEGGPVNDSGFRSRVWLPAITAAGVRRFPPRVMRHTAASWLVQDVVPLVNVQALLGHESYATTLRYAHLAPDAHSRVIESWTRRGAGIAPYEQTEGRPS